MKRHCSAVILLLAFACTQETNAPEFVLEPAAVAVVSGHAQAARAGQPLANPLLVRVTDAAGRPMQGVPVLWEVDAGVLSVTAATTNPAGLAEARWIMGASSGAVLATASVEGVAPVQFRAWSVPSGPATIEPAAGADQTGLATLPAPQPPTVLVRDSLGQPLPGAAVAFRVRTGGGWLADNHALTDSTGRAAAAWYLGPHAGVTNTLEAITGPALVATFQAQAAPLEVGGSYTGRRDYIEYLPGDLPLVMTVPHGGTLTPEEIPDRTVGTIGLDLNTDALGRTISDVFHEATGHRPHVIINHLHRAKLDANRDRFEGAQGNPAAELAWREFHAFAEAALAEVRERHGRGFFVDLHAHGHQQVRIELGYLLNGGMLAEIPDFLNAQYERTSIRTLVEETGLTLIELLRGPASLGAFLAERGYPAVPSPVIPHPGGHAFFSGGYNTERYGSRNGGPISGVQLEAPIFGHLDTAQNRLGFARAFLRAFDAFFAAHYGGLVPPR